MRKKEIKCPYCGSKAKLVHFYDIYGKDATHPERYAWACARFPQCDSYVSTIKGSTKPAGTLADAQLRHERIEAHRVIKKVVESGMDQHSVYRYLEDRMGLQRDQLHIASSGIYYCRLVQQILKSLLELFRYTTIISDTENSVYTETVINNVLEDCISSYYAIFKEKGITPNINLCEQKIVRSVDKTALLRIFNNVIDNAIKYSEGDLTISLFENGKIVFSNHTSDLNEIQIGKLFDRFYTVNTARKSTGLGLSIAKALIEKMDGNISADYSNNVLSIIIKLNEV